MRPPLSAFFFMAPVRHGNVLGFENSLEMDLPLW